MEKSECTAKEVTVSVKVEVGGYHYCPLEWRGGVWVVVRASGENFIFTIGQGTVL